MNFLHSEVYAGPGDVVRVNLAKQANVKVMDGYNFRRYRNGQSHEYYGGLAEVSPWTFARPIAGGGTWRWTSAVTVATSAPRCP